MVGHTQAVVNPPSPPERTLVRDALCRHAKGGGNELGPIEALDSLVRPGASACNECVDAEVVVPAMELGNGCG